jgi:uncharacterized protein (UPF0332 family)
VSDEWTEIAKDCLRAANSLKETGHYRSAVSRAYYAAFSMVVAKLTAAQVSFEMDREGPSHSRLPDMVRMNLPGLKTWQRRDAAAMLRVLYRARLDADYSSVKIFGRNEARESVQQAWLIFRRLGVET